MKSDHNINRLDTLEVTITKKKLIWPYVHLEVSRVFLIIEKTLIRNQIESLDMMSCLLYEFVKHSLICIFFFSLLTQLICLFKQLSQVQSLNERVA